MSDKRLAGCLVIAVIVGMTFALSATQPTRAMASGEVSAGEQLGLKRHGQEGFTQTVTMSLAGDQLFGFNLGSGYQGPGRCQDDGVRGYLGFRRRGGPLQMVGRLDALATPPVIGGDHEAVVVSTPNCSTKQESTEHFTSAPLEHLRLLRGPLGRRPTTATVLSSIAEPGDTKIAASPNGELSVAWLRPHGRVGIDTETEDRLYVSIGHTSGSMSPPKVLGGDRFVVQVHLAWAGPHELLVVYAVNKRIVAQTWRPGQGFDRPQTVGGFINNFSGPNLTVSVGPSGSAAIAWGTQEDTGEPQSPWKVFATVRPRSNARFGVTHLLDTGITHSSPQGRESEGNIVASIGTDGVTNVAWCSETIWPPSGYVGSLRTVTIEPSGHFNAVQQLAPECHGLTLTETPEGETLLQWEAEHTLGQAIRQPGGESFGPAMTGTRNAALIDGAELIDSAIGR